MKYNIWLFGTEILADYVISFVIQEKSRLLERQVILSGTADEDIFLALKEVNLSKEMDFLIPSDSIIYRDEIKIMRGKNTFVLFWKPYDVPIGFLEPVKF